MTDELQTGDQPIVIEARDGTIHNRTGSVDSADATLTGPAKPILGPLVSSGVEGLSPCVERNR